VRSPRLHLPPVLPRPQTMPHSNEQRLCIMPNRPFSFPCVLLERRGPNLLLTMTEQSNEFFCLQDTRA
jgi:hypothetical protein